MFKVDFAPLFDSKFVDYVPHAFSEKRKSELSSAFESFTDPSKESSVFSGYRRQICELECLSESVALAEKLRSKFEHLVVLGIGGSALGPRAIHEALKHRVSDPRGISILDNLDPVVFEREWAMLDLVKTAFVVISKSGGTLETMAQASVVFSRLEQAGLQTSEHIVAITDPTSGVLRKWVSENNLPYHLEVPADVGGRFSVFTSVGLFPLAFAGHDAAGLIEGAKSFFESPDSQFCSHPLSEVAHRLGALEMESYSGQVLMPYATILKEFSAWFVQLWGESLGKESRSGLRRGSLPVSAVGATDQHSLLQFLVEGPRNLITGFIEIENWGSELKMEKLPSHFAKLSFAEGHSFGNILSAQSQATQTVLRDDARPTYRITIKELDHPTMGALMGFFMDLTSYAGAALDINPYDQPGVEKGKVILPEFLKS